MMERLTTTGSDVVTLSALKTRLRVEHDAEDSYLSLLLASAHDLVERETAHSLRTGRFRITLDAKEACRVYELGLTPVISLESWGIVQADGRYEALEIDDVTLDTSASWPRLVLNRLSATWMVEPKRLIAEVSAGYAELDNIPAQLKLAVLLIAAHWYSAGQCSDGKDEPLPATYADMLKPFQRGHL